MLYHLSPNGRHLAFCLSSVIIYNATLNMLVPWSFPHVWVLSVREVPESRLLGQRVPVFIIWKVMLCCCWVASVVSNSVPPHRRQPTRLPHPRDSPGKNTGVGCHFLLQCMKVKTKLLSRVWLFRTPWTAAYQAPPPMGISRQEYWSGVPLPSLR